MKQSSFKKAEDKVNFVPDRFENTYLTMDGERSRLVYFTSTMVGSPNSGLVSNETGEVYVGHEAPADIENWKQDEDVLDTWFSSALWPFSTMGWPDVENEEFKRYYPTDALVTGYDIIFFWVSRMIFQGIEFTGKRPFDDVLIHGLVRDEDGRRMSEIVR